MGPCAFLKRAHTGPLLIFDWLSYLYYTNIEELMYGARDYIASLGYGAMRLFEDEILRPCQHFVPVKELTGAQRSLINILYIVASPSHPTLSRTNHYTYVKLFENACRVNQVSVFTHCLQMHV